jgi:hypothetical protein
MNRGLRSFMSPPLSVEVKNDGQQPDQRSLHTKDEFVRQYLELKWSEPHLYHAMFNTKMGESCTATMLIECVRQFERDAG